MTTEENWQEATDGAAANTDEWREVEAEAQIIMEMEGDGFIGRFMGMDPPNASGIIQGHFTMAFDLDGNPIADTAFLNCTRDLINKLKKVPVKAMTRIQWTGSIDTGHESGTKMRIFTVQFR